MELLKKLIKTIAICVCIVASQTIFCAEKLKAMHVYLTRPIVGAIDYLVPGIEGTLRSTRDTSKFLTKTTDMIMKALAIPDEKSVDELDAAIVRLRKELEELKAKLPKLKPATIDTSTPVRMAKLSIEKIFFRVPRMIHERQEKELAERIARAQESTEQERREIEEIIQAIEKASGDEQEALRYRLKQALDTSNLDIELFTESQKQRSGLDPEFLSRMQAELEVLKQKAAARKQKEAEKTKFIEQAHEEPTRSVEGVD